MKKFRSFLNQTSEITNGQLLILVVFALVSIYNNYKADMKNIDLTSYINNLVIVEMYDRTLFKGIFVNITKDIVTLHDDADILIPISTILNIYVID